MGTDVDASIGRLIASVPESTTMDVYNAFKGLVGSDVPAYLMSTVKEEDAKAAYAGLMAFKDVVKANPITPTAPTVSAKLSSAKLDAVGAAAGKLSSASYPFIQDVDWTSDVYLKPLPGVSAKEALTAIDKMIVMGGSMDGKLLKEAAEAHHKAIGSIDAKGVTSAADYEAVNAALGKLIASVPRSQVMDVYNSFAKILGSGVVANNMFQFSKGADAIGAYSAFLNFKDVASLHDLCGAPPLRHKVVCILGGLLVECIYSRRPASCSCLLPSSCQGDTALCLLCRTSNMALSFLRSEPVGVRSTELPNRLHSARHRS